MPRPRALRRKPSVRDLAQSAVCWLALAVVCGSALILAANRPAGWLLIAAGATILLALQIFLDLGDRAVLRDFRRLWPAALLWLGVVVWTLVQAGPAPMGGWAHPSWADAGVLPGSISVDPEATYHGALRLISYAALFWIAAASARNPDRALTMLRVMAIWSVALALFGIVTYLARWNPILGDDQSDIVMASFRGPNTYALYAGIGLYCCLGLILLGIAQRNQGQGGLRVFTRDLMESALQGGWLWWLGLAVMAAAVFYTGSRAGSLSVLAGLLVLVACALRRGQGKSRLVLVGAIALPLGGVMLGAGTLAQDLLYTDLKDAMRPEVYTRTLGAIEASPWLGYGLGGYREAFRAFMSPEIGRLEFDFAHNSYLENAFELGVPAAIAFYLAIFWVALQIWRGLAARRRWRALPATGIATLTSGGLHALVDFSLQMPAAAALTAMLLGTVWSQSTRDNAPKPHNRRSRKSSQSA